MRSLLMEQNNECFIYTYSAAQQDEVKRIREKYLLKEPDKMDELRRLDASVTNKGLTVSLIVGILGTLVLGLGVSCCLVWMGDLFIPGIILGLVGLVGVSLAYPLYARITKKERERIAPEILKLTEELMR